MKLLESTKLNQISVLAPEESLYHYTTAKALMNIVSTNEFWVTHANFLNDYSEIDYIEEVVKDACHSLIPVPGHSEVFAAQLLAHFRGIREGFHQMYLLSFSTHPDSLTLWSEFSNGHGYSMELCAEDFRRHINVYGEEFRYYAEGRVIYSREEQIRIIKEEVLIPWLPVMEHETSGYRTDDALRIHPAQSEAHKPALSAMAMNLYEYAPFFKHETFRSEEEYRFVFYCREGAAGNPDFCSFREKDGNIIPFIKINLKLSDGTKLPIRRIVAGPKNKSDLAIKGAQYLLACHGYGDTAVGKSGITLRY